MSEWKTWIPQYDGHAPDDWCPFEGAKWVKGEIYSYPVKPLQDATYEPDLLAQCLALPQDQREALIEAMQKPQRDWADDVTDRIIAQRFGVEFKEANALTAAVIRSMCRPKEVDS